MALNFQLQKATESLQFELKKRDVETIVPCQVKVAMDVSGSFHDEHTDGYTQDLLNRFVPFAMLFDKDGVIDSYTFASYAGKLPLITKENYSNYIKKEVIDCYGYRGGTYYVPVLRLIDQEASPQDVVIEAQPERKASWLGRLTGQKDTPAVEHQVIKGEVEKELVFFVTDGESSDTEASLMYLQSMAKKNIFFVFIGVGTSIKLFRDSFANTPSSIYLELSKSEIRDLKNWTDEQIYDKLLQPSLITWMNKEI